MPHTPTLNYRLICVSESRGLQHYTARLANALKATGKTRLSVAGQARLLELLDDGITPLALPSGRRSPHTFVAIARTIFTSSSPLLHYQGINIVTLFLLALASRLGWRVVLTPHNVETHFRNRVYNSIKWPLWRSFSMIILHTEAELKLIPADLRPRIAIIPHGEYSPNEHAATVSNEILTAVSGLGPYILAPGFVRDDKNLPYLLGNINLIKSHGFVLVVAGRNLSSLSSEKIASATTYFDGFLPDADLNHLIASAHAVVLPYDKVSESGVLHQALSVGTPVIASDIPSFRERLCEGENGWFLDGLTPQALDAALTALSASMVDRPAIARCHRDAFSWSGIAARLLTEIDARRLSH